MKWKKSLLKKLKCIWKSFKSSVIKNHIWTQSTKIIKTCQRSVWLCIQLAPGSNQGLKKYGGWTTTKAYPKTLVFIVPLLDHLCGKPSRNIHGWHRKNLLNGRCNIIGKRKFPFTFIKESICQHKISRLWENYVRWRKKRTEPSHSKDCSLPTSTNQRNLIPLIHTSILRCFLKSNLVKLIKLVL